MNPLRSFRWYLRRHRRSTLFSRRSLSVSHRLLLDAFRSAARTRVPSGDEPVAAKGREEAGEITSASNGSATEQMRREVTHSMHSLWKR
jgi:hypothetical protein